MLRIERKSRKASYYVGIKEKSRLLTPTFLAAFGIAFALHFAGILLFHISPVKLRHADLIFRPVQVNIDYLPLIDSGVLAELENEAAPRPEIPEPPHSEPKIKPLGIAPVAHRIAYPHMKQSVNFPFGLDQFRSYAPNFIALSPPSFSKRDPVTIRVGGDLSQKNYFLKELDMASLLPPAATGGYLVRKAIAFRVKLENRTGRIFWLAPISDHERKKLLHLGEKVLARLQFEKSERGITTEGEIEIEFTMESGELSS